MWIVTQLGVDALRLSDSLSIAALIELQAFKAEHKVLPDPTEDLMLAKDALPPALHVIARWMWTLLKLATGTKKLNDRCLRRCCTTFQMR